MKLIFFILLVGVLLVVQALVPKRKVLGQNGIHPKKTLKEWLDLLEKSKYVPPNPNIRGSNPQPVSSGKIWTPHIVGGDPAEEGQFPWQVSVVIDNQYFCGGSLISENWVLTAAHCVASGKEWNIRAGSLQPLSGGQGVSTTGGFPHEDFNKLPGENDIGLIEISGITLGENIKPVLLPSHDIGDLEGKMAIASGWGKTSDTSGISPVLMFAEMNIVDVSTCMHYYGSVPLPTICVDTKNGKSICGGDSGGPLVIQGDNGGWFKVGIAAFGAAAGCEIGGPVGFTRVTEHLDWISNKTGIQI